MSLSIQDSTAFVNNGTFEVASATTLSVLTDFVNNGTLSLSTGSGIIVETGSLAIFNGSVIGAGSLSVNGGVLDIAAPTILSDTLAFNLVSGSVTNAQNLTIPGAFNWLGGTVEGVGVGSSFTTAGLVSLTGGNLLNTDWTVAASSTVDWIGTSLDPLTLTNATITNQGLFSIASFSNSQSLKNLTGSVDSIFINKGTLLIDAGGDAVAFSVNFDNIGGAIDISSGIFSLNGAELFLDQAGETLQGFGTFFGNVINIAGTVTPGKSDALNNIEKTGTLTINGDYTQGPAGTLDIKLDSTILQGLQHDVLHVAGLLTADGTIKFRIVNNKSILEIAALLNQSFEPLQFNSFAGKFAEAIIPAGLNFTLEGGGIITISSDIQLLNDVAHELEILLNADNLDFSEMVQAMRFVDQKAKLFLDEDEDEEDLAPRLVCK